MPQDLHPPAAVDAASEARRHAFNAAFHELDLDWHWDAATYARLQPYGRAGIRAYIEEERPHLLRAYPVEFLVALIESTQLRCLARILPAPDARHGARLAA